QQQATETTERAPVISRLSLFAPVKDVRQNRAGRSAVSPLGRQLWYRLHQRLVKSERFDIAVKLTEGVKTFGRAGTGIAHQVVESVLAGDDNEVGDASAQPHSDDYRIATGEIAIDQLI